MTTLDAMIGFARAPQAAGIDPATVHVWLPEAGWRELMARVNADADAIGLVLMPDPLDELASLAAGAPFTILGVQYRQRRE